MTARRRDAWVGSGGWEIPALSDRDRRALANHTHSAETARRCRIVLLALEGWSDAAIADHLGMSAGTVAGWRSRFSTHGIAGLVGASPTDHPTPGDPKRARRVRGQAERDELPASGSPFLEDRQVADRSGGDGRAVALVRSEHRFTSGSPACRVTVEPPLASSTMELIGVYVAPQAQVAGLIEVLEPQIGPEREPEHTAPDKGRTPALAPLDGNGAIRWLPQNQPLTHQLGDFLRQLRRSVPGRRLHVVTDNAAACTWLRALRSRDSSLNLVAHLAVDPHSWSHLMDAWEWTQDGSAEDEALGQTSRRLRAHGHRFSWQRPSQ